jgi:putative NADH-flavin reductase
VGVRQCRLAHHRRARPPRHAVTAIARNPETIAARANVTATKGDLMDQVALTGLLSGHDAAID